MSYSMKTQNWIRTAVVFAVVLWLGSEFHKSHQVDLLVAATRNDLKESNALLASVRQKHAQPTQEVAKNETAVVAKKP